MSKQLQANPRPAFAQYAADEVLPLNDSVLADSALDLVVLTRHWARYAARRPMTAEQMRGADRRARAHRDAERELMEQAGVAVAIAARALLNSIDRPSSGLVLVLAGPGNNGGDALVAARHLDAVGVRTYVCLVSGAERPGTPDAAANWDRLDGLANVQRMHGGTAHDVGLLLNGLERAALIIDGLLGLGMRGELREPVGAAVEVCLAARRLGVPVLAIDTPTALDLSSGETSEPNVRADLTVTFHRPKTGLLTRAGMVMAGRILVAPVGIPKEADVG